MAIERPDFANWTDEDFDRRADEVSAYFQALDLSDADWMSGAEYRLRIAVEHTGDADGPTDTSLRPLVAAARADGSTWDRVGNLLGTSGAAARKRFGDLDQAARVQDSAAEALQARH